MFFDRAQRDQIAATLPEVLKRPFVTITDRIFYARMAHALIVGPENRVRAGTIIKLHAQTARNGFTWLVELPAAEVHLMRGREHRLFHWLGQAYLCALRAANDWADRVGCAIEEAMHPNRIDLTDDTREEDPVDHWHAQFIVKAKSYGVLEEAGSPGPEWDAFRARYLAAMQGRDWTQGAASELWAGMMCEAGAAAELFKAEQPVEPQSPGGGAVMDSPARALAAADRTIDQNQPEPSAPEAIQINDALTALVGLYTNGIASERIRKAGQVLTDDKLTANEKLTRIDGLLPIPPTASGETLGKILGVTKQAVSKTDWWIDNRKGEKASEIGRRRARHEERAEGHESAGAEVDDSW